MKTAASINIKNIYYPPGGILMWIIIYLELITFSLALLAMVFYNFKDSESFHNSRLLLNPTYGMVNTIFLLTSGLFMALSVKELKQKNKSKAKRYLIITILLGIFFLGLKSVEYYEKLEAGLNIGYNTFFSFYWMLTLFHVIHVIIGLVILISVFFGIKKETSTTNIEDVEASATFWHMCDLIWLLLFPVIYLLF